jgi:hypothetical protein
MPTPIDKAIEIEKAEINDANPAKIGLKMLQDEAAKRLATDGQLRTNAFIHSVREKLIDDGYMPAISAQSIFSQMQPGEQVSENLDIYSSKDDKNPRHIYPSTDLDLALEHNFVERMGWIADGHIYSGWNDAQYSVSYAALDFAIEQTNQYVKARRVGEDLKMPGPNGPLWKILQSANPDRNIDLDTVDRTMSQHASELSEEQVKALQDLKTNWNTNFGAKRCEILWEKKYHPSYPANGQYLPPEAIDRIIDPSFE